MPATSTLRKKSTTPASAPVDPAAVDDTRTRLIDAAEYCYAQLGVNGTGMADIAAHAQITRRTVYRYFANGEEILDAVVRREVARFWDSFHATQKRFDDLGRYLVEALIFTLKHAPTTHSHRFLFNEEVLPLVNRMYIDNRQHTLERVAVLRTIYENHQRRGGIRPKLDLIMLCEWFNRLAVSYLAAPSPFYRSEKELRALFRAMLLPIIAADSKPVPAPRAKRSAARNQ